MGYKKHETKEQRAERLERQDERLAHGLKQCTCCHEVKALEEFPGQHVGYGGKESKCTPCKVAQQRPFMPAKRRRMKQRQGPGKTRRPAGAPPDWRQVLRDLQGERCPYCQELLGDVVTMEHMDPRTAENHTWENVILVHRACNSRKGNRTVEEWRPELLEA